MVVAVSGLGGTGRRRTAGRGLVAAAVLAGAVACAGGGAGGSAPASGKAPEAFGAAGYRGLTPGQAKDAALATGALQAAPVSTLGGCTDFSYQGGPAPDPARMAAETAAETRSKDLNAKADEAGAKAEQGKAGPGASAREYADDAGRQAEAARLFADATQAIVDEMKVREARDAAFAAAGGASFGKDGLRELAAPAGARTAEGVGAGSTLEELKQAYGSRGLELRKDGRYQVSAQGPAGWMLEFTVADGKVGSVTLVNRDLKCV